MKVCGFLNPPSGCSGSINLMLGENILVGDTEIFDKYLFAVVCNDS